MNNYILLCAAILLLSLVCVCVLHSCVYVATLSYHQSIFVVFTNYVEKAVIYGILSLCINLIIIIIRTITIYIYIYIYIYIITIITIYIYIYICIYIYIYIYNMHMDIYIYRIYICIYRERQQYP